VALKLIKPGMDSRQVLSRFEAERQALALMDHPNIAKVYDGGMTEEGRPFFVMEYVKGVPITDYCDQAKLPIAQRLKLFASVCQAVQHAHQKGIIHRDLKPSNLLVCLYDGQPVPKVIDFGLAKATSQPLTEHTLYTAHGLMVGTPLYMSPEQAEFNNLDVDTRTDVYSLGVILYELLTGTTPLEKQRFKDAAFAEILRLIKEEEPLKPSTKLSGSATLPAIAAQRGLEAAALSRLIRGDLDWIVMKSLEKERARRYETASGLARDLERYLADEPVEARPPSLGYRLSKLARRNKKSIATAAVLGAAALVVLFTLAGSIGWIIRDGQTRQAVVERKVLLALDDANANFEQGDATAAAAAVDRAEGLLATAETQQEVRDRVNRWKGDLAMSRRLEEIELRKARWNKAGQLDREAAAAAYRQAYREYGIDPTGTSGAAAAASRVRESGVARALIAFLDDWAMLADSQERQTLLEIADQADTDPWRSQLRDAIVRNDREQLRKLASDERATGQAPVTILLGSRVLEQLGERSAALDWLGRANERYPQNFWINHELSRHLLTMARPEEAASYLQTAVAKIPDSPSAHNLLGGVYVATQQNANAEREFREAVRLDPGFAVAHQNLAFILHLDRKLPESIAASELAVRYAPEDAHARLAQGNALLSHLKAPEARAAFEEALRLAPNDWIVNDSYLSLVRTQFAAGAFESECRERLQAMPDNPLWQRLLGDALALQQKFSEAEAAYRETLRLRPSDHLALAGLAGTLLDDNRTDQAAVACGELIRLRPDFAWGHVCQAAVLRRQQKFTEAEASLRRAIELDPYNFFPRVYLGALLREQNKFNEAIAEGRKGVLFVFRLTSNSPLSIVYRDGKWLSLQLGGRVDSAWFPTASGTVQSTGPSVDEGQARAAIRRSPNSSSAHVDLARALLARSQYAEAEAMARQAIRLNTNSASAYVCLGSIQRAQQRFDLAERSLGQALKLKPGDPQAQQGLAMVLEFQGKHAPADAAAREAARLDPSNPQAHFELAWLAAKRGDLETAEASYREEIRLRPSRAASHQDLGWVLHRRGKLDEARQEFDQARKLDPSLTHARLGDGYATLGLWWQAEQHYLAALRENPEVNRSGLRAALLLLARGERAQYETVCKAMQDRFAATNDRSAGRRTAQACLLGQPIVGDLEQLRKLLEAAVGADEDPAYLSRERGLLAYRSGDWEGALAACDEARATNASSQNIAAYNAQARLIESLALARLNRSEEARACYYEAARRSYVDFRYAPHYPGSSWADWLIYDILRREAAGVLGIPEPTIDREAYDRAWVAARQGDWKTATREFLLHCEAPHSSTLDWNLGAAALVMAEDVPGYRQHCQKMLVRFSASDAWEDLERVCKASVLHTEGMDLAILPVDRFTSQLENRTAPTGYIPWGYASWAIVAYRAGEWHKAVEMAKKAIDANPSNPLTCMDSLFVGALANHRLGNREESLRLLKQGAEMFDANFPKTPQGSLDMVQFLRTNTSLYDALIVEILRQEAIALIGPDKAAE
jgi:tetratricopeptide (TPR) repeat protein